MDQLFEDLYEDFYIALLFMRVDIDLWADAVLHALSGKG